jgi:hypothetical protein
MNKIIPVLSLTMNTHMETRGTWSRIRSLATIPEYLTAAERRYARQTGEIPSVDLNQLLSKHRGIGEVFYSHLH